MPLRVNTSPNLVRKLCKSALHLRRELSQISKAEEHGKAGAREARERLTRTFQEQHQFAQDAIAATRGKAASFERAALILRTNSEDPHHSDPLAVLCAHANRLGSNTTGLADSLAHAAGRATEAADKAEARYDANGAELDSVALLALLTSKLPSVGFDQKNPKVADIRKRYLDACYVAKKSRKGSR